MMKRTFLLACCVASLLSGAAAAAADVAPAARLGVAQIVQRNVDARGGLAAWRAVSSMTLSGDMDAGGKQNTTLPFVLSLKRPNKTRLEIRFQEQTAVQVYDGAKGWKLRPFLGRNEAEPYTPAEAKLAAAADLDAPLVDYAAKGTKVALEGTDTVEGKGAYKLRLTRKSGNPVNLWVDASSFLELKMDGEPRKMDGRMHKVAIFFRDYKKVNGLTLPYLTETVVEGVPGAHKMAVKTIAVNPSLEDALFAKPQLAVAKAPAK
jgi:outer membrane lipoprotein-sorting protein